MNSSRAFFAFVMVFASMQAVAIEKEVKSKINSVTVFTQGAQIFRSAAVSLKPGKHTIIFTDLSYVVNASSIQVGGKGDLTILSVSSRSNYLDVPMKAEKETELQSKIEEIQNEINRLNGLVQVYHEEEGLLLANKNLAGQQNGLDVEQLMKAADFFRLRLSEIKLKRLELNLKVNQLREEERIYRQELSQISNSRGKSTQEILVNIDVHETTSALFEFNYTVRNASWQPYYDVRMEDVTKPIKIEYKAKVQQSTGVDWKGVALTLSSGNPTKNNVLPAINPWYIDFGQAYSVRGGRGNTDQYMEMEESETLDEVVISSGRAKENGYQQTIKSVNSVLVEKVTNIEYDISSIYTIKSGNLSEDVAVRTIEVPAMYEYRANTKLDETAYLVAKMYGWHNFNLLNGSAKLFNQGTFVGEAYLNIETTEDTLLLSLGRDENIVIKRERLVDLNGTQMIGSNRKLMRYWSVSVRNNKKQPIRIVITDQIPVSRQKQITVKLEESDGAQYFEQTGYLIWAFDLPSASTKGLKFGYSVKHPKGTSVSLYD